MVCLSESLGERLISAIEDGLWLGAFSSPISTKDMKSPRPKRLHRERGSWEAAVTSTLDATKKVERKAKPKALKLIPLEPLPPQSNKSANRRLGHRV